ncbi:hypothetical protein niasHS_002635 [Heterodera schachtii]|uniref:Golgi SNAP receptor complex member 2 n=1 Tax=Heterodera schachtii TaxID=97005 RepID=A0ABD2K291_HETSC
MEQLFQQANMDLHQIHLEMRHLELCKNESEAQPLFQKLHQQIRQSAAQLDGLERLVNKEPSGKRHTSKYRFEQLRHDYNALEMAINSLQNRLTTKWRTAAEREELLTMRFKPNETHLDFEGTELLVNDRLKQSHNAVDDLIAHGNSVLTSLRHQHLGLKDVKRKMLDIGQVLGLSTTTLQMIEKRLEGDWLLFLVLCVLCVVFMYCFYRFWKG